MPLRTLIVEDDDAFRRILEIRLRSWRNDLEIHVADTIGKAQSLLENEKEAFSLVILDQHLPDGKGSDLLDHPKMADSTVLSVSSDDAPELPGKAVRAGARHFLYKRQVTEPLFLPLLNALLERNELERELVESKIRKSQMDTIRTLLATLRHEINNPLGAVLGGAYILRSSGELDKEQTDALRLIEASGNRIKHVLSQLCDAAKLETVTKAREKLFHVPGDEPWDKARAKTPGSKDGAE